MTIIRKTTLTLVASFAMLTGWMQIYPVLKPAWPEPDEYTDEE